MKLVEQDSGLRKMCFGRIPQRGLARYPFLEKPKTLAMVDQTLDGVATARDGYEESSGQGIGVESLTAGGAFQMSFP